MINIEPNTQDKSGNYLEVWWYHKILSQRFKAFSTIQMTMSGLRG